MNGLIVFTKLPVESKVKTRLAEETGDKFATAFYKVCAEYTFNSLLDLKQQDIGVFVFYSEDDDEAEIRKWIGDNFYCYPQKGNNLGEKMYNAFDLIFRIGYKKVVIIGTDIPDISRLLINKAFTSLDSNECVLGPANDGGYYLLGIKSKLIDIFSGIKWGTNTVLNSTIENLEELGVTYTLLEKLIDIDTKEDLNNWVNRFKDGDDHIIYLFIKSRIRDI